MQQFIAGFTIALSAVAAGFILYLQYKRKKASKTESDSRQPLQLDKAMGLIGELAHEIKNPLSTIKINLKLTSEELVRLERGCSSRIQPQDRQGFARANRKIAVIAKEADRLEQVLDGFLRYAGKVELQTADVDLNELVSDMVDFYSPQGYSRSITVRLSLSNKPLVCKIDADALKQTILNLFINAQQAMSEGGELMVSTAEEKPNAVIRVSDTGSGIAPDKLERIFDVYYSSRARGSGLGLPTTKKIIQAHEGTITVDSELGKGTLFTIRIPLKSQAG